MPIEHERILELTATIVAAHVGNNAVAISDLPLLISNVATALDGCGQPAAESAPALVPAVSVRSSIKPDYLVCLDDGRKLKMLRRHLSQLGMTPDQYRERWGLPASYPMVAPNYSEQRRGLAIKIGLGTKRKRNPAPARAAA